MKKLGYTNAVGKKMQYQANQFTEISHRTIIGVVKDFHVIHCNIKLSLW